MHQQLDPVLRRQHGAISRTQALAAGVTSRSLERLVTTGRLTTVMRGVYCDPATPTSVEQRALSAVLGAGEGAIVSHRLAVALHKLRNYQCDLLEVLVPREVDRAQLTTHRYSSPVPHGLVAGIPVTTPARTLLDFAAVVGLPVLTRCVETWTSTGVVALTAIEDILDGAGRHPGKRHLDNVLSSRIAMREDPDSPAEALLGALLVRHGLAVPDLHHLVTVSTGAVFELDWSYPHLKIAFELDGYGIHLRSFDAFENDRLRRNELEIDGWAIMNFTRNLVENRPERVISQVTRMIARRADDGITRR